MAKRAISVTLDPGNLLWLEAQMRARRRRSISETLDAVIQQARNSSATEIRSVVGTITVDPRDPDLLEADQVIRAMFDRSLRTAPRTVHRTASRDHRRRRARRRHE